MTSLNAFSPAASPSPVMPDPTSDTMSQQIEREALGLLDQFATLNHWLDDGAAAGLDLAWQVLRMVELGYRFPEEFDLPGRARVIVQIIDNPPDTEAA